MAYFKIELLVRTLQTADELADRVELREYFCNSVITESSVYEVTHFD